MFATFRLDGLDPPGCRTGVQFELEVVSKL
jgi:hypothetical protein